MPPANNAPRTAGVFLLDGSTFPLVYGPAEEAELRALFALDPVVLTPENYAAHPAALAEAEVIFSSWGVPRMDAEFLAAAPKLRAVFHAAGSIRPFVTDAFWERGIVVTSAAAENALPVAEFTVSTILLSLKHFWRFAAEARAGRGWGDHRREVPGTFRSTVGLISSGLVARRTSALLAPFALRRLMSCPFLNPPEAAALGVELVSLETIFREADVISLHTPELPATRGMITGAHFATMKPGATFINTARGAVVREAEMLAVLAARPDLTAVLDVSDPEPPAADSPLLRLPNVVLTPHIAGSLGRECQRLGQAMVAEAKRWRAGEPLQAAISHEMAARLA